MRDLQPADECKRRDVFTVVGTFGELALGVTNVRLRLSHSLILMKRRWWFLASRREAVE